MCSQNMDAFHKFYEKVCFLPPLGFSQSTRHNLRSFQINEIQKNMLKDRYELTVLKPVYNTLKTSNVSEVVVEAVSPDEDHETDNMVEVLFVSDDFEEHFEDQELARDQSVDDKTPSAIHLPGDLSLMENDVLERNEEIEIIYQNEDEDEMPATGGGLDEDKDPEAAEIDSLDETKVEHTYRQTRSRRLAEQEKAFKTAKTEEKLNETPVQDQASKVSPRRRGRTKATANPSDEKDIPSKAVPKLKKTNKSPETPTPNKPEPELLLHENNEGESDDEFPSPETGSEDWPVQQALSNFPKQILKDGLLLVKGKELMSMICR